MRAAYKQLLDYREALDNPPLLVVCDLDRFEVHTNFTGTTKRVYTFSLADLASPIPVADSSLSALEILRAVFTDPVRLRPNQTPAQVTEQAAAEFAKLSVALQARGAEPERVAHFLMRLLFCLFAEDISLLPPKLLTTLVQRLQQRPREFGPRLRALFAAMASGGFFGVEDIQYFDGGLFNDDRTLDLLPDDLAVLVRASQLDWASIEPAIFGTLFERSLDPAKRTQIGAHYTSRDDILLVVEPVLMQPLLRRWGQVRRRAQSLLAERDTARGSPRDRKAVEAERLLMGFAAEIAAVRVLDPACGSGNFLYVALKRLLDLEMEVIRFAAQSRLRTFFPQVGPEQLHGIEINTYAHELTQVVVWIGYIQWMHENGFGIPSDPILKQLANIEQRDAIIDCSLQGLPVEPPWPEADVIIGNPPFLGGKFLRRGLGDSYVEQLFALYDGRVPREADLVTYWFERARLEIASGHARRAGLLATQGIRGGANRRVLDRVKDSGDIFLAWSDRPWVLEGAAVHISIVGFDDGSEGDHTLNGVPVTTIHANLTSAADFTAARPLKENLGVSFMGDTKGGSFEIPAELAQRMLAAPLNPNGRPNSDVVHPWVNGLDITRRPRGMWIVDFAPGMSEKEAALYELPFEYVLRYVKPQREVSRTTRREWWLHERPRTELRRAIDPLARYIGTPRLTKHRLFVWLRHPTLPDSQIIVISRADDYCFGVLHSTPHELMARAMGTQLREFESGFRYTPTTTFETFPFPWPLGSEPSGDPRLEAIAAAARDLSDRRDAWLNPPGASEAALVGRTLTNLYNDRPSWLAQLHQRLDAAVIDAYGWPPDIGEESIIQRLLALNLERADGQG